jgi:hypothetical protein
MTPTSSPATAFDVLSLGSGVTSWNYDCLILPERLQLFRQELKHLLIRN